MNYGGTFGLRRRKKKTPVPTLVKTTVLIYCRQKDHTSCPNSFRSLVSQVFYLCVCPCHKVSISHE